MPRWNLAFEIPQKLLNDQIKARGQRNVVDARSFKDKLEQAMQRYQNRALTTAEIIQTLIDMAKDLRDAHRRGDSLGLSEDELAFYDALEVNDSAVQVLGDETLKAIARELVQTVKASLAVDWAMRESVRAHMRTVVRRLLRKYGYSPDKAEKATETVIQQAEVLSQMWVG